jgi:two-component system, cell cycle sensor histidine kinase and response regulator CckA
MSAGDPGGRSRTGLGLALVYSTIQLAGGRIRLESTPGRGSTVRILLPVAGAEPAVPVMASDSAEASDPIDEARPQGPTSELADGASEALTIVVVEDEPGVRLLVERILSRAGHRVLAFPDGSAAEEVLADPAVRVDLLLTDLVMPGPNGIEVARQARRSRPELPVVIMSGYAADALRSEGLSEDSLELLSKPFSTAELLERVNRVAGQGTPGR